MSRTADKIAHHRTLHLDLLAGKEGLERGK
jgi:hypothetical protein